MSRKFSRREWMRWLGAGGAAALARVMPEFVWADDPATTGGFHGAVVNDKARQSTVGCPTIVDGKVVQPARGLPILHTTDVLVVGGGPAGVCAALAAKRTGADVTLVERYGHFGGLWSGGLVLIVIGHIIKGGQQVVQGVGEEILKRLEKTDGAIINRQPGVCPTVDAEALKYVMVEMIEEAQVKPFLHCWGVDAIMDGHAVRGVVFESKSGRQAILAKTVVDATGDGDVFAAAGAEFEHRRYSIGLVSRIGNMDKVDPAKAQQAGVRPKNLGSKTPAPGINWVNMQGPSGDALDVAELTRMEMNHRRFIWNSVQKLRSTPGYEQVCLVETAPQLGVRITRVLNGLKTVRHDDFKAGVKFPDVIGIVGASVSSDHQWQVPYGALLPKDVDQLLAAGRCISADMKVADSVRLIPNCFVSGHAAGVAAALSVRAGCRPRDLEIGKLQAVLKEQEAYLG